MKEYVILYDPRLAKVLYELGLPSPTAATLFLRQAAHWLGTSSGYYTKDGKKWIYNSYQDWIQDQFPSLSESQFGRMFRALKNWGFVLGSSFAELKKQLIEQPAVAWHEHNTTTWLSLNFERIYEVTGWLPPGVELPQEESPEPAPEADLHICSSDNSNLNPTKFKSESPSIYIENHISHHTGGDKNKKETGATNKYVGSNPSSTPSAADENKQQKPVETPNPSKRDNSPRRSQVPKKRTKPGVVDEAQVVRQQYIWEIAEAAPYPLFLNWRATVHYKPQGGRWETGAHDIAYAEFYNNPDKTTNALFPAFMNQVRAITERIHQAQANGAVNANSLPSWFIEEYPEPTLENVQQLMSNLGIVIERGTNVVLPTKSNNPSSLTVPYDQINEEAKVVKPLPQLETKPLPPTPELALAPPTKGTPEPTGEEAVGGEIAAGDDLQKTLLRKQIAWKSAPIMRTAIKKWASETPGVVITADGPALENSTTLAIPEQKETDTVSTVNAVTRQPVADTPIADPWGEQEEKSELPECEVFERTQTSQPSQFQEEPKLEEEPLQGNNHNGEASGADTTPEVAVRSTSSSTNSNSFQNGSTSSLIKLILAMWDNMYELGKLVLNAPDAELQAAAATFTPEQRSHIRQAATRAWSPGLDRDADYKGERVEIWEVGQSANVTVRTMQGSVLKVRRNNLQPWLGI